MKDGSSFILDLSYVHGYGLLAGCIVLSTDRKVHWHVRILERSSSVGHVGAQARAGTIGQFRRCESSIYAIIVGQMNHRTTY